MSALEAVSNNISAFDGVSFPVVVLEDITSYVNQSREAVLSAVMALTSLETALGANSSIQVSVCHCAYPVALCLHCMFVGSTAAHVE